MKHQIPNLGVVSSNLAGHTRNPGKFSDGFKYEGKFVEGRPFGAEAETEPEAA